MIKRTTTEIALLSLSLLITVIVFPFALFRWYNGESIMAIIDALIALTTFVFFLYVFITRKINFVKNFIAGFLALAVLGVVFAQGQSHMLWVSPTIIAFHYLLSIKFARALSIIVIILLLIIIYPQTDLITLLTVASTTGFTASLSYIIFRSYEEKNIELTALATIDPLTLAGNRRALDSKLSEVIKSQQREAYTMCLILVDIDYFKNINDDFGHAIGDSILRSVANIITKHTRVLDLLYRYGGDEFIIMPLNMNSNTAKSIAENIRDVIEHHEFTHNIKLTLSMGVAEYKIHDTPESWISRADESLYKAKSEGRNKVY